MPNTATTTAITPIFPHKAYIQSWIDILKDKPNELFKAISDADKIVDYMEEKSLIKTLDNEKEMELDEYEI